MKRTPFKKRVVSEQVPEVFEETEEPKKKKPKKAMAPDAKYAHFIQKSVVRGKAVVTSRP